MSWRLLLAVIAWLIAAACVAVGAQRLRRIHDATVQAEGLLADLRKARRIDHTWSDYPRIESELGAVLSAASTQESIAALNERLGEVARELAVGAELPRASARIGLFSGVVLGVVELARTVSGPGGAALGTSGAALFAGIAAAAIGFDLDRRARAGADRVRNAWNGVSSLLAKSAGEGGAGKARVKSP